MSSGQYKNLNIMRTKRTLKVKSQAFLIIFNELSFKQMKHFFFEGEIFSPRFSPGISEDVVRFGFIANFFVGSIIRKFLKFCFPNEFYKNYLLGCI